MLGFRTAICMTCLGVDGSKVVNIRPNRWYQWLVQNKPKFSTWNSAFLKCCDAAVSHRKMTQCFRNTFYITSPLCGKLTDEQWMTRTRGQWRGFCYISFAVNLNKLLNKHSSYRWFSAATCLSWKAECSTTTVFNGSPTTTAHSRAHSEIGCSVTATVPITLTSQWPS